MEEVNDEAKNKIIKYFENTITYNIGDYTTSEYDEDLIWLYEIIENYAYDNYILPEEGCNCIYYRLKYKQNYCTIGYSYEAKEIYYITRDKHNTKNNIIDVMDIVNNKRQLRATLIDSKMEKLKLILSELKIANLEEEFIDTELNKIYKKTP